MISLSLMAEEEDDSKVNHPCSHPPQLPPPFVEVVCKSSGKIRRFAAGTEAKFAVSLINRKLNGGAPLALHIEATKEGEEPVSFGPNSVLVDYSDGWKLQTVTEIEVVRKGEGIQSSTKSTPFATGTNGTQPAKRVSEPIDGLQYFGKIFVAFILIFVLGAIFTLALENLPKLILFINSSMQ